MELHGKGPPKSVTAIIPARYASTRLPGKLLLPVAGKPLLLHAVEQTHRSRLIDRIIVATDDERIVHTVRSAGFEAVMTSADHRSGSDRIAEVAATLEPGSIVVNVQGDEPTISPITIDAAISTMIGDETADIVTTCEKIAEPIDVLSPDVVKVVLNDFGEALYFSRSPIPYPREAARRHGSLGEALVEEPELLTVFRKHTGLYVYRRDFLLKFCRMSQSSLESCEMLEQLRALENGARIVVVETNESSLGVDTEEDLARVRMLMEAAAV